jgi:hypothetical protein
MASSIFWIPIGIVFHYFISQFSWFGYLIQPWLKALFSLLKDILMACHASK